MRTSRSCGGRSLVLPIRRMKVADFNLKLKSQKPIRLTLQRYVPSVAPMEMANVTCCISPHHSHIFMHTVNLVTPTKATEVRFISKIWHPNISSVTGAICLDILKDQWAAAMTLRTVLLSLQALLAAAEPDDPQDAVVANQYKQNPEMFKQTARLWSHVYAGAPVSSADYNRKIDKLCAMGFDKNAVIAALSSKSWDVETATELLLSN
ncbi:ubiquitin-conjugating enzyme E2Kb (UBC1 homolog, yeast) isoform X1 [Pungitius pungitius]|uniref:ubiquitin-conjugating enzyme E2Kb (UBC1 homolog, yeast) isoform X1 n=1 Tax=Pungitius pungitius TaxID=134920 RepID=UPI002E0FAEBA